MGVPQYGDTDTLGPDVGVETLYEHVLNAVDLHESGKACKGTADQKDQDENSFLPYARVPGTVLVHAHGTDL